MNKKLRYITLGAICVLIVACESKDKKVEKQSAPSVPSENIEILRNDANAIHVRLNSGNQAMIEGEIVDSAQVKEQLRLAKRVKGDTATVVMYLRGNTAYGMFAHVHQSLEELLVEERDSVAQLRFDTPFNNLSDVQQTVIKRKHHLRIIEKMRR
jgi:biopolymer transport protein ExbD